MKYCPNCGTPNKDDAQFCANCGAPMKNTSTGEHLSRTGAAQNKQPTSSNVNQVAPQPPKKSHGWLIALLVIVIIVLVFVIGGVIGSQSKKSNAKAEQSAKAEVSQKKEATPNNQTDNSDSNLSADNLTPQQTATAIAYYQGTNSLAWSAVSTNQMSHDVYVQKNGDENISNKGAGVSYWFGAVGNGYSEYTLSDNGKTVNIYQINSGSNSVQDPKESVSLQTVIDTVNSKHAAQKIRDVANGVHIKDYRSDSDDHDNNNVDTTKLNKDQVKDWALRSFKDDYSDYAGDDLSTEYLGIDDDNYAEVEVHDHDNSDMDTTYRVNGSGELQEKTGDGWTTVSDSY